MTRSADNLLDEIEDQITYHLDATDYELDVGRLEEALVLRYPFGWRDVFVEAREAVEAVPHSDGIEVFAWKSRLALPDKWRRWLNDRIKELIPVALKVWGPMSPEKLHEAFGSDGSNAFGGLIGYVNDRHDTIEKEEGEWRATGAPEISEDDVRAVRVTKHWHFG